MSALWRSIAGCAVLLLGLAGAAAQPTVSQLLNAREAAGAKAVVERARNDCLKVNGHFLVIEPGAVSRHDLTGNGRADYVIDFTYVRCERLGSIFCGTGGCELSIVVALPRGKFREVFRQQVIRYEIEPSDGSMRTIRFDLHGVYCGKTGPEPCRERRLINGERFVFRGPV
jgi:hypothetical protein